MSRGALIPVITLILLILDFYGWQAVKSAFQDSTPFVKQLASIIYWGITVLLLILLATMFVSGTERFGSTVRNFIITGVFTNLISKILLGVFLLLDDLQRVVRWISRKLMHASPSAELVAPDISRSEFLVKAGIVVAAIPVFAIGYGIIKGAHDYRVRRVALKLPNLPRSFHGLQIAQISDVHSGSFFSRKAVSRGVSLVMDQKADVVFFTGDLVNNEAGEMKEYVDVFRQIKAPMGVFSILGNHDYGDYYQWSSAVAKQQNLKTLIQIHRAMGWDILINEHRILKQGKDGIAVIGIENWGAGQRWPKYGKMTEAYAGTRDYPVKLLLSHDPSHWDAQVRPQYPDIDVMFSGHTHGFQFGVEAFGIKWSPVQYVYKQWAGLYQANGQSLYVNRGFGYLGLPGRIGMPPEITVFQLSAS